jgi:hypothetical protein
MSTWLPNETGVAGAVAPVVNVEVVSPRDARELEVVM